MRTSFIARGAIALAVLAGAGLAGTAGASAAVPCGEGTMTPLTSPTTVYCEYTAPGATEQGAYGATEPGAYGVTEPTPPRFAAPGGLDANGAGVPAGFENAGRPSRLLSGSAAVAGLADVSDLSVESPLLNGLGVR
ncbi:hypothetical protein Skr01_32180 [Sphaerisporangium krabiense]|uniref:Uncharacterized protein n=1 Tax=Sphaerisporangium krabiense TaxID=763782 RepID=A0A7W9DNN7_9ACTN|nr:hypothetical protein [Sphaerisporangium krabiense]MBB5625537.1 hypothetical protein [Sphaerisporangium krabiense]GII63133.1 hypothetical protein Skr01_32180 [Sphaerisporangium krabiense]